MGRSDAPHICLYVNRLDVSLTSAKHIFRQNADKNGEKRDPERMSQVSENLYTIAVSPQAIAKIVIFR